MYKLFKKNESKLKFLLPLNIDNKMNVAKLITESNVNIGYSEDGIKFIEINQCPKLKIGDELICKNLESNINESIGRLIDIDFNEDLGYLLVFKNKNN